ncbi:MAG: hypothetical protein MUE44_15390 [Oscillatoriaceae cyanobacterium Prado104]|jgi:hypothetical protein|nr:hypothetical protein [Oscillatoriaceae cyanobacterium Prado104]
MTRKVYRLHPNPPLIQGREQDIYKSFAIAIVGCALHAAVAIERVSNYMNAVDILGFF